MGSLANTITITQELRPCYVDGKKAFFHRWAEQDKVNKKLSVNAPHAEYKIQHLLEEYEQRHILPSCCDVIKTTTTVAIIEYEDGSVAEVEPIRVKFADNKIKEYAFN